MRIDKWRELSKYASKYQVVKKNKQVMTSSSFLKLNRYAFTLNDGTILVREQLVKNGGGNSAAVVVPMTPEGNVILILQPRVFSRNYGLEMDGVGIEVPAGYIESEEQPLLAAKRELEEETGYRSDDWIHLASYYQDQGCMDAYNQIFLARNCKRNGKQALDQDEYITCFECTYEEALEFVDKGYINDANSILALMKLKNIMESEKKGDYQYQLK